MDTGWALDDIKKMLLTVLHVILVLRGFLSLCLLGMHINYLQVNVVMSGICLKTTVLKVRSIDP